MIVEVLQDCCWQQAWKTYEFKELFAKVVQVSAKADPKIDLLLQRQAMD